MTREFSTFGKSFESARASAHKHTAQKANKGKNVVSKKGISSFFGNMASVYSKAVKTKRAISSSFVSFTEVLADKTAREGLFGEDRGKNYCGTDTDYIA